MAATIHLEIVTPERKIASVDTDEVIAPGASGLFGVRPGHAPFLTMVQPGELSYREGGHTRRFAVGGGFIEVENDRVRVLADTAEAAEETAERARVAGTPPERRMAAAVTRSMPPVMLSWNAATSSAARPVVQSRLSSRWSPTRSELAIAVSAGFTAPIDGKMLVSTTYRLSSSCARQSVFTTDVAGSCPNLAVPA